MSKEFMKRYTLQRDPSEIESVYSDEKIGCEMDFTMQMAFESMIESFAKQTDKAIINFLIKKYRNTNVSDIFVFSETDFKQFIIDMVPKWRNEKKYLKWEDLEFKDYGQEISVLLNDNKYSLKYKLLLDDDYYMVWIYKENKCIISLDGHYSENKQFFNDLRLERV